MKVTEPRTNESEIVHVQLNADYRSFQNNIRDLDPDRIFLIRKQKPEMNCLPRKHVN